MLQRLDRRGDAAETAYRRAIEFAGALMARASNPVRATIDRADVREALALLVLEAGNREAARGLLEGAVEDLRSLAGSPRVGWMLGERFTSLAEGFRKLGDVARAEEVSSWAGSTGTRPARKPADGAGERKGAQKAGADSG